MVSNPGLLLCIVIKMMLARMTSKMKRSKPTLRMRMMAARLSLLSLLNRKIVVLLFVCQQVFWRFVFSPEGRSLRAEIFPHL